MGRGQASKYPKYGGEQNHLHVLDSNMNAEKQLELSGQSARSQYVKASLTLTSKARKSNKVTRRQSKKQHTDQFTMPADCRGGHLRSVPCSLSSAALMPRNFCGASDMVRIEADAVRWQAHRADFDDAATGKPEYLKRDLDKIETAESIAAALAANLVREYGDEIAGLIANAVNDQIGF